MEEKKKVNLGETMGLIRTCDELGRIVIPIEFRKALDIDAENRDKIEIFQLKDGLFIRKAQFKYKEVEGGTKVES